MTVQSIDLAWIVVKDLKNAIKFYTEVLGMKLEVENEMYGWAELVGQNGGMRLGIAQQSDMEEVAPGSNAILTLKVANIDASKKDLISKGAKLLGDIIEVPGQVKMQTLIDTDGNRLQIVELLSQHL